MARGSLSFSFAATLLSQPFADPLAFQCRSTVIGEPRQATPTAARLTLALLFAASWVAAAPPGGKMILRASLPNQQHTAVQAARGQTLRAALEPKLKRRQLTPEMCDVFSTDRTRLSWDAVVDELPGESAPP